MSMERDFDAYRQTAPVRWSTPAGKGPSGMGKLRVNPTCARVLERLVAEGPLTVADLSERMSRRPRDFRRRVLKRLVGWGAVEEKEGTLFLASGWREALARSEED